MMHSCESCDNWSEQSDIQSITDLCTRAKLFETQSKTLSGSGSFMQVGTSIGCLERKANETEWTSH